MAPTNLLNVVALALLALHGISFATPTNALSLQGGHIARRHSEVAHRNAPAKRTTNAKRCKARSSSALPSSAKTSAVEKATTTSTKKAAPAAAATTTAKASAPTATKAVSGSGSGSDSGSGSSGSGLRGKACLAWPNGVAVPKAWQGNSVDLVYTWDATKPSGFDDTVLTYAPMLWGWKNAEDFKEKAVEGYATIALGPNEPNEVGQSNMDAESGIQIWREYMLPLASKGYTLISPAMSSRPNGKDWMDTFMKNCGNDCAVSGIATHYYGTDIEEFKTYVTYWHTTYNLPVYVTEYADQDFNGGPQASSDEIWSFMTAATEFANSNDWLKAHCWFGAMRQMDNVNPLNQLMDSTTGTPNDLGSYFINN